MIKLNKSKIPKILIDKGIPENNKNCLDYDEFPDNFKTGEQKFKFKNKIYADKTTIKEQLKTDQNNKCAYCETKYELMFGDGDVEHFRPKGSYKQERDEKLNYPGYYWLAYNWNNLLFSCERCNRKHKGNLFPIKKGTKRIANHKSLKLENNEDVLLVNPYFDEPDEHLGFNKNIVYGKTEKGKKTIEVLGLNKPELQEKRREYLKLFQDNFSTVSNNIFKNKSLISKTPVVVYKALKKEITKSEKNIKAFKSDKGQYQLMIKSYLKTK